MILSFVLAQATDATAAAPQAGLSSFLPFILMILVVYFLILRPQMRQQKDIKKMISELKIGDEVILASGLHGRVANLDSATLKITVAQNVDITVDRAAVQSKKTVEAVKLK